MSALMLSYGISSIQFGDKIHHKTAPRNLGTLHTRSSQFPHFVPSAHISSFFDHLLFSPCKPCFPFCFQIKPLHLTHKTLATRRDQTCCTDISHVHGDFPVHAEVHLAQEWKLHKLWQIFAVLQDTMIGQRGRSLN